MPRPQRYATVWIKSLNAGSGEVIRNFDIRQDFEQFWRSWVSWVSVPLPGAYGSIGDGVLNLTYKLYREELPTGRTMESRLLEYKNRLHLERNEPVQLHAFDSWKASWYDTPSYQRRLA